MSNPNAPQIDIEMFRNLPEVYRKAKAEAARRSLKEFTKQAWPILEPGTPLKDGWVIDAICEHLEAVVRGDIKRLVINIPPGAMKSRLTRVMLPLYIWTTKPWARILGASYALTLAERDNYYARSILQTDWYKDSFGVTISAEQGAKVNFDNDSMGGLRAISVGGATTGFRGDFAILDDAHNVSDGESDVKRAEAVQWFSETFQTRLNDLDNSPILVIGQRIHQDDVYQTAINLGYEHLNIPMEWDESYRRTTSIGWTDPRTEEGRLMWPERFSAQAVARLKDALGPYAAAAQLQQTPVPRQGGMFQTDRVQILDSLPDEAFISVRAWDLAGTEGAGAFTVGVKMLYGTTSNRFFIADLRRERIGAGAVRDLILSTAEEDGIGTKIILPQDPGQAGKAQIDDLIAMLAGFNARAEIQSGSKEVRAEPLSAQMERGNIACLKRTWTRDLLDELRFFPRSKWKDQVDAASSAFNALAPLTRQKKRTLRLVVDGERVDNWTKLA